MSDTTVEQTAVEPNGEAATVEPEEVDYKAKYEETLAHSRDWEKRAKQNKAAAEELEQLREAQKTAEQKQAEEVERLRTENAGYKAKEQRQAWTKDVAEATGVPAEVLRGTTLEEIQAHAEQLKPAFETPAAAAPQPVPTIGRQPVSGNVSLPDQIAAAEAAGDKALVAALKAQQLGAINS